MINPVPLLESTWSASQPEAERELDLEAAKRLVAREARWREEDPEGYLAAFKRECHADAQRHRQAAIRFFGRFLRGLVPPKDGPDAKA